MQDQETDQQAINEFANFFRSEIQFELDYELLSYNQKRQKTIQKAKTKSIIQTINEKADSSKNKTPVQNNVIKQGNSRKKTGNQKTEQETFKVAPTQDNIVVTKTYNNFIQVTEIAFKERYFKLSFRNARLFLNILDQDFLPLFKQQEKTLTDQPDRVLHQKRLDCGVTCYFELTLGYFRNQLVLKIAEFNPLNMSMAVYHTIFFNQHSINLFRQRLVEKINENEAKNPKFFTRSTMVSTSINDVIKVELCKEVYDLSVPHLILSMVENKENQSIVISVPAVYKGVHYLQQFDQMILKINSTDVLTHWADEKDFRYEFTLSFVDSKLCLTIIKTAFEQLEEKQSLQIAASYIDALQNKLFQTIKASRVCLNCGIGGHILRSCSKENSYIKSCNKLTYKSCYSCGEMGHLCADCPQQELDTAQMGRGFVAAADQSSFPEIYPFSKNSSSVQDKHLENGPECSRRTISTETDSELEWNNEPPVSIRKPAEFKGKEISVEVIDNGDGQPKIIVDQIGTRASRFTMNIKTAKELVGIFRNEFMQKYNNIEDKSATSLENKYICKHYLKAEGKVEFELAFVLNRFNYMVQVVEVIPINGNFIYHTVVLPASDIDQFCKKCEVKIEEAEALVKSRNVLRKTTTNEYDKDDGFFEIATLDSAKTKTSVTKLCRRLNGENSLSLTPFANLQFFIKEHDGKHYIGISDSNTQKLHLSIPVAYRCVFYIEEFYKFWKSKGTSNSMRPEQFVKEEDCRYDLHYFENQPFQPFLKITEKYENPSTKETTQNSICVAASSLLALYNKLFREMDISDACRRCGMISHHSKYCEKHSVIEFSRVEKVGACLSCGVTGHFFKDCPERDDTINRLSSFTSPSNKPSTSRFYNFASSSKNLVRPSTSSIHFSLNFGLEFKVKKPHKPNGLHMIELRQVAAENAKFCMSFAVARSFLKRLEINFIPFYKKMDIKDTTGLVRKLIEQRVDVSDRCRFNFVLFFENAQFFLQITEYHLLWKSEKEIENKITMPAEFMQEFYDHLQKKIEEAETPIFIRLASTKEIEREKRLEGENVVSLLWTDNRCYILISAVKAKRSKVKLSVPNAREFTSMLKIHQEFYQSLEDKNAKCDHVKFLKKTEFDGRESQFSMIFGLNFVGYFLRIVETYFSPIVAERVERTIVVSGHAIAEFIEQVTNAMRDSNACFMCGQSGHKITDCTQPEFRHKHCYKCGSTDHFHKNCTTDKTGGSVRNQLEKRCKFCQELGHIKRECQKLNNRWK